MHPALFPILVGDLYDRVRPVDQPYFLDSRGKRLGTTDFAGFQAKAREKGVAAFRAVLEPARRVLKEQPFLCGEQPGLSRLLRWRAPSCGPASPARSRCSKPTIRSTPGASACSTCSTAWAARPSR